MVLKSDSAVSALSKEFGAPEPCPHCSTVSTVEPAGSLRYRCQVCGGPRVVIDDASVTRSGRDVPALKRARQLQFLIAAWRVGAGALAGLSLLSLAIVLAVLLFVSPGVAGSLIALALVALPFALALIFWIKATRQRQAQEAALDEAWSQAAADVLQQRGEELSATDLARVMHVPEPQAEAVLAQLSLHDFVRTRVSDGGDLLYSAGTILPRTRINVTPGDGPADGAESDAYLEQPVAPAPFPNGPSEDS